ncbi:MAG: AmmeMemoRadiSam system protein B [Endomicrobiia bacterium]|nr:AmmeMemoRadiSam system protein B [Endomicrobiia bacterium]
MSDIRQPAVAGSFYPASKRELADVVKSLLASTEATRTPGTIVAAMAPHAGYVFSGDTAAKVWAALDAENAETFVLVGNSHAFSLDKGAVWTSGAFATPLGDVLIDEELASMLLENGDIFESAASPHIREHSLEVQLPFIQAVAPRAKITPVLLSSSFSFQKSLEVGRALAKAVKKHTRKTIIIASSDMSHFPSDAVAREWDSRILEAIGRFDCKMVDEVERNARKSHEDGLEVGLCGKEAVVAVMTAAKELGAETAAVLHYANSSDASRDKSRVVGYGAALFLKSSKNKKSEEDSSAVGISAKNQKILLKIARSAITSKLFAKNPGVPSALDTELLRPAAVFVTLTSSGGALRGCIGATREFAALHKAVREMAIAAAFEDSRFAPVTAVELNDIKIEISVLSKLRRVASADDIKTGIDGVSVRRGAKTGIFLPQVWEHFARKEDFLDELCYQKAGLPPKAWKDSSTELYVFTVTKFKE